METLLKKFNENSIKIKLLCNWCDSKTLTTLWNKMTLGQHAWYNLTFVDENPDYYIIINNTSEYYDKKRSIIFYMEPDSEKWGLKEGIVYPHSILYNNLEWHLSLNYHELKYGNIIKKSTFSTILSHKYSDPGHKKRVDFVKFLDKNNVDIDVYGHDLGYKNYRGSLPAYKKDDGLLPYRYTFNVENHSKYNYVTEKFVDAILSECLIFYNGCPNIKNLFGDCMVYLELEDLDQDLNIIKRAISENWYDKYLYKIKEAKKKILEEYSMFPRLETLLKNLENRCKDGNL